MATTLLKPEKNSVTISSEPAQPAQENVFLLYLQERRRALLTELKAIEQLQAQLRKEAHAA